MTGGMDAAGREEKAMARLAQAIRLGESNDTLLARPQSIKKWIGVEMRYSRIRAVGRRARRCTAANDSGDNSELEEKIKSLTLHSVVTPKAGDREINVEKKMVGGGEALAGMGEEETRLGRTRGLGTGGFAWFDTRSLRQQQVSRCGLACSLAAGILPDHVAPDQQLLRSSPTANHRLDK